METTTLDRDGLNHNGEKRERTPQRPETLNHELYLRGHTTLTSEDIVQIPTMAINGDLSLRDVQVIPKGVELTETVDGDVDLTSLISAKGVKLPKTITGSLYLAGLTSIEGLELPEEVEGYVYVRNLPSDEKDELRKRYPNLKNKIR